MPAGSERNGRSGGGSTVTWRSCSFIAVATTTGASRGKADPGESDEACALREVKEETGAARELGRELPTTSYRDEKGRSKVVRYWVMRPVQGDAGPRKRSTRSADFPSPRPKTFLRRPRSSGPRGFCEWPEEQMSILLVRHATAGKRKRWRGDDRLRPLDERGLRQAAGLPAALSDYEVKAIYSSPYVRCRQTVEPLAAELGLELQEREELAEGARRSAVLELAGKDDPGTVVLCTHGDVVNDLLGEETEKGSTSVLELVDGHVVKRGYVPPPA